MAGINWGDYSKWRAVKGESGQNYYVIPGNDGWVYDPFRSGMTGRVVIAPNRETEISKGQQSEDERRRLMKAQEQAASPAGQLVPVVGSIGALGAGNWLANKLGEKGGQEVAKQVVNEAAKTATTNSAPTVAATGGQEAISKGVLDGFMGNSTEAGNAAWNSGADAATNAAAGEGSTLGSVGSLGNAASLAGMAYLYGKNFYDDAGKSILDGDAKSENWIDAGVDSNPISAPINMGMKALGMGTLGRKLTSGKDDDQMGRDGLRKRTKEALGAGDDWMVKNDSGGEFNFGADGGAKLQNSDGSERHYYDVDWSDPTQSEVANKFLSSLKGQFDGNDKLGSDAVGMFTNMALAGGADLKTGLQNADSILQKLATASKADEIKKGFMN